MRFERIDIVRFGHLQDVRLELTAPAGDAAVAGAAGSAAPPGLHVIYGPNEAGKSTTLRAITGLLYGIPHRSDDTHTHQDLRVSARLRGVDGEALGVTRRKGRKNTLLDDNGEPIAEAQLAAMLGGVSEAAFLSTFGLDHVRLRQGGEALLLGGGGVGESLLSAAVGGRAVHGVLAGLRQEAEALYLPRGRKPRLNAAIADFREARGRGAQEGLDADAWVEQRRALGALREAQAALQLRRQKLATEEGELRRAVHVLPLLAKREDLEQRFAEVADALVLPEGFSEERQALQRVLRESEIAAGQRRAAMAGLRTRLAGIEVPESLAALGQDLLDSVRDRLGSHRKAAVDLPRRREALRALQRQARGSLKALGLPTALSELDSLRIARPVQGRVRELARARSGQVKELEQARTRLARLRVETAAAEAELDALPAGQDESALAAAVEQARAAVDLERQAAELESRAVLLDERGARGLRALGLFDGDAATLAAMPVPTDAAVEAFAEQARRLAGAGEQLDTQASEVEAGLERVAQRIERLRAQGDIPTEHELGAARAARESALEPLLRAAVSAVEGAEFASERGAYGETVVRADEVADRLRREAEQVAQLSGCQAEQAAFGRRRERLAEQVATLAEERAAYAAQWAARWAPTGLQPLPPAEMADWLGRRRELVALFEEACEVRAQLGPVRGRLRDGVAELTRVLGAHGASPPADAGLAAMLLAAERSLAELRKVRARREALADGCARVQRELSAAERAAQAAEAGFETWQRDWRARMTELRLSSDAGVEEAQEMLDGLAEVLARAEKAEELQRRIEGMERDAGQFERDVKRLHDRHLFQLGGDASPEEMADQLVQRYLHARRDLMLRGQLRAELDEAEQAAAAIEVRRSDAEGRLATLMELAGVAEVAGLEVVERRALQRSELQRALDENLDELLRGGDGLPLSELRAAARELGPDEARARLHEVSTERGTLDEQWQVHVQRVAAAEQGLARLQEREGAAEAAADAAERLAEVRDATLQYLRVRLAERLLEGEVRRNREDSQGPVVREAGQLLSRLTGQAYTGLLVDYGPDDEPTLRCVQAGGQQVPIDSLSEGTRDQLYLALRLASLRQQASHAPPMPLLLDDILVHFDDARARAALAVLGEFAEVTQVLFFTHHEHLLGLCREAVPAERHVLHRLGEARVPDGALFAEGGA